MLFQDLKFHRLIRIDQNVLIFWINLTFSNLLNVRIRQFIWIYLQRVWYCSQRIYVGRTLQLTHSNKHMRFYILNLEMHRPLLSSDAYFSPHLLSNHGGFFSADTAANIQPLWAVSIISLSLIIVLTTWIEPTDKGIWLLRLYYIRYLLPDFYGKNPNVW